MEEKQAKKAVGKYVFLHLKDGPKIFCQIITIIDGVLLTLTGRKGKVPLSKIVWIEILSEKRTEQVKRRFGIK